MLKLESRPKPTGLLRGKDTGDEFMFYDPQAQVFHSLNGTAREIFMLCDGTRSVDRIAETLAERYDVDIDTARADTLETMGRLHDLGVLAP